jgi:hypothetical protein
VIKAVLPIRKWQKLFLAASFVFFRVRLFFFWKFFFVFSESEHAQGLMIFSRERPLSSPRPRSSAETVEKRFGARAEATTGAE